jgi:ribosome biogenesis GTPase
MVSSENGIDDVFKEIIGLSKDCKFTDCTHTNEPKCAVLEAVEAGTLSEDQYQNYLKLKKEADFYEMAEIEKRNKDRKFGKFIKKALEQLEKN